MDLKIGSRAVFAADLPVLKNNVIKAGTPCTIFSFLNSSDIAIVRYGYDKDSGSELIAGVSTSILKEATPEDVRYIPSYYLLPKHYSIGERFISKLNTNFGIGIGDILTIAEVELSHEHESKDMFDVVKIVNDDSTKVYRLNRSFLDHFEHYIPEFHDALGEEIDMKKKNYFLPLARMTTNIFDEEEFVILVDKVDEDNYIAERRSGEIISISKQDLSPITKDNNEILYDYLPEEIVPIKFKVGNSFKAKEEIKKHILLNGHFDVNDVVVIKKIDSVNVNVLEDTFVVSRTGGNEVIVSYADLINYFDHYASPGMVKQTKGKIETVVEKETNKDVEVEINSLSINKFNFSKPPGSNHIKLDSYFTIDQIELLTKSLLELEKYMKKQ